MWLIYPRNWFQNGITGNELLSGTLGQCDYKVAHFPIIKETFFRHYAWVSRINIQGGAGGLAAGLGVPCPRGLGFFDLDLGSSPGWWAATVATYCPSRMVEHSKSKSTQPSCQTTSPTLYASSRQWQVKLWRLWRTLHFFSEDERHSELVRPFEHVVALRQCSSSPINDTPNFK